MKWLVIIERVTLTNFMSYRNSTEIDLSPNGKKNITLIVGHGGAGKTNIGKAIRWALYKLKFEGTAGDDEYDNSDLLRLFFREGGGAFANRPPTETSLSVKLEILPGEAVRSALKAHDLKFGKYTLERSASVGKIVPTPRDVVPLPLSLKGPNQREVADPEGFIEEFLLPASTSTFFMFHGDRIRDLTAQIDQPVTESIKQILDVTAMNNAVSDLQAVRGRLARQVAASSEDESQRLRKEAAMDKLQADEKRQLELKREKVALLEEARQSIKKLISEQSELLEAAGLFPQYDGKETEKKTFEDLRDGVNQQIRTLIDQVPKEILYHTLHKEAVELHGQDDLNKAHQKSIDDLEAKRTQLQELLRQRKCPVCKQPYPDSRLASYKEDMTRIETKITREREAIKPLDPALEEILQIVTRFESSKYDPHKLEEKRYEYNVRITDLENTIAELKAKLRKFTSSEGQGAAGIRKRAKGVEDALRAKEHEAGKLDNAIKELDNAISQLQRFKQALEKDLVKLGGGKSSILKRQYALAEALHETFSEAVIELANEKRQEIATETGEMLRRISIKPELLHKTHPVDVDEDFQVREINYEGNPLVWSGDATSEREMLAVSFIYGLLKASEREAPVILDTFFGNLDPNQIRKLTGNLSSFGSQIVLMTTLTEFRDLAQYAPESFWDDVCRYVFLRDNKMTDFVTTTRVITDRKEAEKEAALEQKELAPLEVRA